MQITVVGYGNVGTAMVKQLTAPGHKVEVTGRKLEGAEKVAAQYGAKSTSLVSAAKEAELVVLADDPRLRQERRRPATL
ncbi:NAD(P)-binding domain-containing protein [Paraburkholderia sp. HP33-1]|uniref:NAD(P)-binding domain-containing protein n=1 Tax=Paraburkholderia sp. HP33-1 TaxID=2883243 RepID=UPI001F328E0E|nr:NAD(P)-binding domain-containing protein [Paraburkholderia sp. HP33-1]